MSIKTPKWLPEGSRPTAYGWVSDRGELLKSKRISSEEIAEWHAERQPKKVEMLVEAPSKQSKLSKEQVDHFHSRESVDNVVESNDDTDL
jgi:hypothetical protein